jgi:hypothetical protein
MANLVKVEAQNALGASLGIASYTAFVADTVGHKLGTLRLIKGSGGATDSTDTTAGTEVTDLGGSSYTRFAIPDSGGFWPASVTDTTVTNSGGAATFTNMPMTTVYGIEIWDNTSGTPVRKWFGSLDTPKSTGLGDTISFPTSSISASLV